MNVDEAKDEDSACDDDLRSELLTECPSPQWVTHHNVSGECWKQIEEMKEEKWDLQRILRIRFFGKLRVL